MKEFSFNLTLTPTYHKIVEYFLSIFISKQINLNFMEERRGLEVWIELGSIKKLLYINLFHAFIFSF